MDAKIKILHLEDLSSDAEMVDRILRKGKIDFEKLVVDNKARFEKGLKEFLPDIILSDHTLPDFDSTRALKMVKDSGVKIPFILVTATVSEEFAVEVMKQGANDYILKDRLQRLPSAMLNALEKSQAEKAHNIFLEKSINREKKFRHTLDTMLEGIQIHDFDWRYIYVNDAVTKHGPFKREDLLGFTLMEKYPGIEQSDLFKVFQRCMKERTGEELETEFTFPDGTKTNFELFIQPIEEGLSILSIDRTEQKKAKEKLAKSNRLYSFISQINQSIVHIENEEELIQNSCQVAVEYGKFRMAWIGMFDIANKTITLASQNGIPGEEVKLFHNTSYADNVPQDYVLSTGSYYLCNDIANSEELKNWWPFAAKHSIQSCIILPIKKGGSIVGTFNLYSTESGFFDTDEITMLEEVTGDISFALSLYEKVKNHNDTQVLMIKNERRFRAMIENSADMKALTTSEGKAIYGSPSIMKWLGYTQEEFMIKSPHTLIHADDLPGYLEKRNEILNIPAKGFQYCVRLQHKNGDWIWCEGSLTNMLDDVNVRAMVSNFRDVSAKVAAEKQREFDANNLNALINNTNDLMWSVDRDFNLITSNHPFDEMSRINFGAVIPKGGNVLSSAYSPEMLAHFKELYERAFAGESFTETEHFDFPVELWTEISYYPISKGHEVIGTACHSRDITASKHAEVKLHDSEKKYRDMVETSHDLIWAVDTQGIITYMNKASRSIYGYEPEELIGTSYLDLLTPEELDRQSHPNPKSLEKGDKFTGIECEVQDRFGKRHMLYANAVILYDDHGKAMGSMGTSSDITERKETEKKLLQSEASLKEAQALSHISNWGVDLITGVNIWSDEFYTIFDIKPGDVEPSPEAFLSFIHPEDASYVKEIVNKTFETFTASHFYSRIITKDGIAKYVYSQWEFELDENNKPVRLYGILQDITERKKAELLLSESEARLAEAQALAKVGNWETDLLTFNTIWSLETFRIFELSPDNFQATHPAFLEFVHSEDRGKVETTFLNSLNTYTINTMEHRIITPTGSLKVVEERWQISRDNAGKPIRAVGTCQDITERKKAEVNIRRSEFRLKEAQSIAHLGNWELNFNTGVALWSDETCRIYGLAPSENQQSFESFLSFIHPDDVEYVMAETLAAEKTLKDSAYSHRIITKDGTVKHVRTESKFELDKSGKPVGIYGISQDVTEREIAEKEREKITADVVERNKDLEQFSYIVSHNLRAPVANIKGLTEMLRTMNLGEKEKEEAIYLLSGSIIKLNNVIIDLNTILQTKKNMSEQTESVSFSHLIRNIKTSISELIKKEDVDINTDFSGIDKMVTLQSYLHSIFYNLISNSIKYRQVGIAPVIDIKSSLEGNKIVLLFNDNGLGIDLEKKDSQIFGLYKRFHTHVEGKGMGLYMVKTQVETLGGKISVRSKVNKGTEFRIEFEKPEMKHNDTILNSNTS